MAAACQMIWLIGIHLESTAFGSSRRVPHKGGGLVIFVLQAVNVKEKVTARLPYIKEPVS